MSELVAKDLGLVLPMYASAGSGARAKEKRQDPRFMQNGKGRITGFKALSDISIHLRDGDRLAIVGRNGSGKSTLLKVLGGILDPTYGHLAIQGRLRSIFNLNLGLNPEASGYRNITLFGLVAGLKKKEIEARLPEIAEFSELGEFLSMPVHTYSAGMRMRLLFSATTALRPDILLLDEWLGAGDQAFREKAANRMAEMVADAGIVVLASHNLKLLRDNCNIGIWIDNGQIAMIGETDDVIDGFEAFQNSLKNMAADGGSAAGPAASAITAATATKKTS